MKTTTLALFLSLFTTQAMATVILSADSDFPKSPSEISQGLGESGFFRADFSCYKGNIQNVCRLIEKEAKASEEQYSDGEHGYFEVRSCMVEGDSVVATYERITDYGNEDVELTLAPCPLSF